MTTRVFCTTVTQPASAEQVTVYHKMEEAVKVRRENAVSLAPRPSLLPMFCNMQKGKPVPFYDVTVYLSRRGGIEIFSSKGCMHSLAQTTKGKFLPCKLAELQHSNRCQTNLVLRLHPRGRSVYCNKSLQEHISTGD